jgi:putative FmdB family regulatory protein
MILYEFVCQDCRREFEELVGPSGTQDVACPNCQSANVKRVLSAVQCRSGSSERQGSSEPACAPGGFT